MVESPMKPTGPGLFLLDAFSYGFNFIPLIDLFIVSVYFQFSLGRLHLSKNLSISSRLSILLACNCSWLSFMILCISVVLVVTSPFAFLILLVWGLCILFLMSQAKGVSIFLIFSKNQFLVSFIFPIVILNHSWFLVQNYLLFKKYVKI